MVQIARPTSDVAAGAWTTQAGGTSNLYATIDESVASDTDFIKSSASPATADIVKIQLGTLTDPVSSTGHKVRYRYQKSVSGGDQIDLTVRLVQGAATTIATWTHTNIANGWTDAEQTLTSGEANAITDYADLRLWFEAVTPSGITDPTDIANLLVWLNADDIALADNSAIDTWSDGSGNGWNATASGGLRPTVQTAELNGHKIVRFDGADDRMLITSFAPASATMTVYVVCKPTTPAGDEVILQQGDPWYSATGGWILYMDSAGKYGFGHNGNVGITDSKTSSAALGGAYHILRVRYDMTLSTNEVAAWLDGSANTGTYANNSNNTGTFALTSNLAIGSTPGAGQTIVMDIAEIIIYTRDLTAPEDTNVVDYLQTKYGL